MFHGKSASVFPSLVYHIHMYIGYVYVCRVTVICLSRVRGGEWLRRPVSDNTDYSGHENQMLRMTDTRNRT